ncbi:MAG TPA: DUF4394 domain-containing protein [Burkholderiaceae bacterium]|nr:DUF4394 domain-containing protein [Burkholderiaceae bacterium]
MKAFFFRHLACLLALGFSALASAEQLVGLTTTNSLITFDSATPGSVTSSVAITGLQSGETILGIDFRPATQTLYGLGSSSRLYSFNQTTGAATQVGSAGAFTLNGTAFGFDFNPTVDRIRVVSGTGQNLRLNPNDGTLTAVDTPLGYAAGDVNAGATPRIVGSAYTNSFAGAATTTLYGIDANLDILASQSPPNAGTLNSVGALGFNTSDLVGFDISGLTGVLFASLSAPTGASSQLFTINLASGAASLVGTIGPNMTLLDIAVAAAPIPEPKTYALMAMGLLALSAVARSGKRRKA